jgi:uncharacterized protein
MEPGSAVLFIFAYLLIIVGVIGSILPVVPGPLLLWLGMLLWAMADGFRAIGWPTLAFMGLLVALSYGADLVLTAVFSRRQGAAWKSIGGALLGGIAGAILFTGVLPVIGTIVGAIVGAVAGIVAVEFLEKRDWVQAFDAGKGYMLGYLAGTGVKLFFVLVILGLFIWQAFILG